MQSPRTASPPQPHRFNNTNDHEPAEPSTFGISSKSPHVQVDAAASRGVSAGRTWEKHPHSQKGRREFPGDSEWGGQSVASTMGDILIWQGGGNYVSGVRKARNGVGWRADWPGWPLNHLGITHPGHPSGRLRRVRGDRH